VMVTFVPGFLNEECRVWIDALLAQDKVFAAEFGEQSVEFREAGKSWLSEHPRPPCSVSDVADHIEHVRQVAGVDHVGLGGDYDGVSALPDGLGGVDGYPLLLDELAARGWSDPDLGKLTWHNAVRVLRDTEAAARAAQQQRGPSLAVFTPTGQTTEKT
jgi:membrane dipeptidase